MPLPEDNTAPARTDPKGIEEKSTPTPGFRWKTHFLVEEPLQDNSGTQVWDALNVDTMNPARLVVARVLGTARTEALRRIRAADLSGLHFPEASAIAEAAEIDIYSLPPSPSLRAWRLGRKSVEPAFVAALVGTLSRLLSKLHEQGVGHFNLRLEHIYVAETEGGSPQFVLGGWDCATLLEQKELISIPVDPFLAPPEAAGLHRHSPGPDLACWDWWSLGRVIQELVLGHHVLSCVLARDLGATPTAFRSEAEELLQGRLRNQKPGGLEAMPAIDPRTSLLLRGLLSTTRDSRWRATECSLWLEGSSPKEHYLISGKEPCLRWEGQAYTIAEMADTLRSENNWEHAADQLLQPELAGTLAWFVHKHAPNDVVQRLKDATALLEDESLQEFPPSALREIVTMIALLQLAGGAIIWRGRRIDSAALRDNLAKEDGSGHWLGAVWALTSTQILCLLDKADPEAGRILTDLGRLAGKTVERAIGSGWLLQTDLAGIAKLWELCCEHPSLLNSLLVEFRKAYACSDNEEVQELFAVQRPQPEQAVLLAFLSADPRRHGFLTHGEWAQREYQRIYDKGLRSARVLFWLNLRRALRLGPWWYGRMWLTVLAWAAIAAAFSAARPGPLMAAVALLPLLLALGIRWMLAGHLRPLLARWVPDTAPWRFLDNASRCQREGAAFGLGYRSRAQLKAEIAGANSQIAGLTALASTPAKVPSPPRFLALCSASLCSWLAFGLLFTACSWQLKVSPPSWEAFSKAWGLSGKTGAEEASLVKMPWPFKQPDRVKAVKPHGYRNATPADLAAALARGRSQVSEYVPETISALTLVRIPSESAFAFLLYDGKRHQIASKQVIILVYNPLPRDWIEIDGKTAFILPE